MSEVRLENLWKRYGAVEAIRGVSLEVREGELLTLLGPSGCGKTTTLQAIAGLVEPDEGEIWIGGTPMRGVPPHRRDVGLVFQGGALFPHLSVRENVEYGLKMRRVPAAERRRRAEEMLALVGLEGLGDRAPKQLSGGQQQRVALARALVIRPRVLLLDEPLSALDLALRQRLRTEIRELQQRLRTTTVFVTHDQVEALSVSDRIAVMNAGALEQIGTPVEVYARPRSSFVAGFVGETNRLQAEVAAIEGDRTVLRADGSILLRAGNEGRPTESGAKALAFVRPDAVRLERAEDGGGDGEVVLSLFLGTVVRYEVRLPTGGKLFADVDAELADLRVGERVRVSSSVEGTFAFPG
jgi:ABC-type Fe3+/spermidine/putrescine transport system ATPase subunit